MPTFYITHNPDCDDMLRQALILAGFLRGADPARADFIVHDGVHPGLELMVRSKPAFIYPHTPQSWFLWDGILRITRCCCNFVNGQAGVRGMKAYGYPYRVEAIGFTRCEVREFQPTSGHDLLIIPAHPLPKGGYTYPDYIEWASAVLRMVLRRRYAFGKVTLCWSETRLDPTLKEDLRRKEVTIVPTNPYKDPEPLKHMMDRIEQADLVLACGTAGCVSAALGKPTIFFSERGKPRSLPKTAAHPELYHHYLKFPLMAEDMSIDEMLAVRMAPDPRVEHWKQDVLGGPFQAEKFIHIVREYV